MLSLAETAELIGAEFSGDQQRKITGVCSLDEQHADSITFSDRDNSDAVAERIDQLEAAAIIVKDSLEFDNIPSNKNVLKVAHPLAAIVKLVYHLHPFWIPEGEVSDKADIHPSAQIGNDVFVGAFSVIGEDCVVEDNVKIYPNVTIYPDVHIGKGSIIHSGAVVREGTRLAEKTIIQNGAIIGADGFGYFPTEQGLKAVPQVGNVSLNQSVEVGANACIDRATLGTTSVGDNTKIDNLVQVGHNTRIGSNSIVCGMTGISGSCDIGNQVTLAGGVGVGDHTVIEDGAIFGARSGLIGRHYKKGVYAGFPARPAGNWRRELSALRKLPELVSGKQKLR